LQRTCGPLPFCTASRRTSTTSACSLSIPYATRRAGPLPPSLLACSAATATTIATTTTEATMATKISALAAAAMATTKWRLPSATTAATPEVHGRDETALRR
ncbi:hypothetical protein HK405_015688, partial [Cladochytrium tenue]